MLVCCVLLVVRSLFVVARWLLFVACVCSLLVMCCSLFVV